MNYDQFKASLQRLKNEFKDTAGLLWGKPRLRPQYDPGDGELLGWTLTLVITFEHSMDFIRLKEQWKVSKTGTSRRDFFTYHYGPYEAHWPLETVECKKVAVRIDGIEYFGRGYHIHDGSKDGRIYQDELDAPDLAKSEMGEFIEGVLKLRYGKSLEEAFGLKFK